MKNVSPKTIVIESLEQALADLKLLDDMAQFSIDREINKPRKAWSRNTFQNLIYGLKYRKN